MGLTDKGEEIASRARNILASVQDLTDYAKGQEGTLAGVLNLGAIPSITSYLLPGALPALQARFPNLALRLRETVTETLVRELVSGDLAVIRRSADRRCCRGDTVFVRRRSHSRDTGRADQCGRRVRNPRYVGGGPGVAVRGRASPEGSGLVLMLHLHDDTGLAAELRGF